MFNLVKGEVTQVKPSFMRNYLHNFNGARYIMQDSDINQLLLQKSLAKEVLLKEKVKSTPISTITKKDVKKEAAQSVTKPDVEKSKPKGLLEREITIKDVKIPGLDL